MKKEQSHLEYSLKTIKKEDIEINEVEYHLVMSDAKKWIFEEKDIESLTKLCNIFAIVIKEIEKKIPNYIDFLISRSYLYPTIYKDTEEKDLKEMFLIIETEMNNVYLHRSTSPNTKDLFKFFAALLKSIDNL